MPKDSMFLGVSVRAWVMLIIVITVCTMSFMQLKVEEPLYSMVLVTISFYFGKSTQPKPPGV
jgi:type IV secretory pathway VirB3-like protein